MTDSYTLLRESVGAVWVPRDVIWVSGAEATEYLQGQLSQDLAPLDTGQSAWTFALQPQGRVIRGSGSPAWTTGSSSMWTTASAQRSLPGSNGSSSARTCSSSRSAGSSSPSEGPNRRSGAPRVADRHDPGWPGVEGIDVLGPGLAVPDSVPLCEVEAYEWLRVEAGVPAMGHELTEETIPAESGVVERSVSFTKGCFTGQELVARIDSRGGNVPRRLRGLVVEGDDPPPPGTPVEVDGSEVGSVTSSGRSPKLRAATGLAYVRRAVEPGATATLAWNGETASARVAEPFSGLTPPTRADAGLPTLPRR